MAILTGKVKSMRVVEGEYKTGKRQGQGWQFLSMEVIDEDSGIIWSCQMPEEDEKYHEIALQSLLKHRVRLMVMGQSAGERELQGGQKIMQIRSQVTDIEDLGVNGHTGR